jgi:hypothetical protein
MGDGDLKLRREKRRPTVAELKIRQGVIYVVFLNLFLSSYLVKAQAADNLYPYQRAYAAGNFEKSFQAIQNCFDSRKTCKGLSAERALQTALELSALRLKNPNAIKSLLEKISNSSNLHSFHRTRIRDLLEAFSKVVETDSSWEPNLRAELSPEDTSSYFWYLVMTPEPFGKDQNEEETFRYLKAFYAVFPNLSRVSLERFLSENPSSQRTAMVRSWLQSNENLEDGYSIPSP